MIFLLMMREIFYKNDFNEAVLAILEKFCWLVGPNHGLLRY